MYLGTVFSYYDHPLQDRIKQSERPFVPWEKYPKTYVWSDVVRGDRVVLFAQERSWRPRRALLENPVRAFKPGHIGIGSIQGWSASIGALASCIGEFINQTCVFDMNPDDRKLINVPPSNTLDIETERYLHEWATGPQTT